MSYFSPFFVGAIKPLGWLAEQMLADMNGFVGRLNQLVPELINDPIYGSGRLGPNTTLKDLGNLKSGDAIGEEQYHWWNSETQSNWWDGYLRHVILLNHREGIELSERYVAAMLETQDDDGYIGIYNEQLRYQFGSENGELWAKATLLRGLIAYYEWKREETLLIAIIRAVEDVMHRYPINASHPFASGIGFNGGVSHGLAFTDVLERLHLHTDDIRYREYAHFLYQDYSATSQSECDAQWTNILDPDYRLKSHGVHTYSHLRVLITAAKYANDNPFKQALKIYLNRIRSVVTISGGAIGDEWIGERVAHTTHTGYEYCSLQELLDSFGHCMQFTGESWIGDAIENTFYNAAQGARHPYPSGIAYLKTDNSFEMNGTKNGQIEPERHQTRYKYSPAHQDVAVCCNPNAGRISPYFLQHSWMREHDNGLVVSLLMPNVLETDILGTPIRIENRTRYPFEHCFRFIIQLQQTVAFTLKIRIPQWVNRIECNETWSIEDGFICISRLFNMKDEVELSFETSVLAKSDANGDRYFTYGAILYALPIPAIETMGRRYKDGFSDYHYQPMAKNLYGCSINEVPQLTDDSNLRVELYNYTTGKFETKVLIPIGQTILRQVTFPLVSGLNDSPNTVKWAAKSVFEPTTSGLNSTKSSMLFE